MVAVGAGLLWLGWNGFNGGDPYSAANSAAAAVLNTNLATAVAFLVWVGCDLVTRRKPSLLGGVNGMIVGLVAITPAAGFVNGYGAMACGAIASVVVYFAMNYAERLGSAAQGRRHAGRDLHARPRRSAGRSPHRRVSPIPIWPSSTTVSGKKYIPAGTTAGLIFGNATLLKWQVFAGAFVIAWSAVRHLHHPEGDRTVHPIADVHREHGARRRRGARPRGVPVRHPVARCVSGGAVRRSRNGLMYRAAPHPTEPCRGGTRSLV